MKRVYLAGPVRGLSYKESMDWREYAKNELAKYGIISVSPMRAKEHLANRGILLNPDEHVISCQRGLVTRDRFDVRTCDVMLANFFGAKEVSIGTLIEYGWADSYGKPIITIIEKEGNPHEHPFIRELTGFRVETLDEGLKAAKDVLGY